MIRNKCKHNYEEVGSFGSLLHPRKILWQCKKCNRIRLKDIFDNIGEDD